MQEKIRLTRRGTILTMVLAVLTCYYLVTASSIGVVLGLLLLLTVLQILKDIKNVRKIKITELSLDVPRNVILGTSFDIVLDIKFSNKHSFCNGEIELIQEPEEACVVLNKKVDIREDGAQARLVLRSLHVGSVKVDTVKLFLVTFSRLVKKVLVFPVRKDVAVIPRTYVVARALLHGAGILPGLGEYTVPKPSRLGFEYLQSRPYEPGDETRLIDWKATARTGTLHVKELEEPRLGADLVILNLSNVRDEEALDKIALLTLLLTYTLVRQGIHTTIVVLSTTGTHVLEAGNEREYENTVRALVSLLTIELLNISKVKIGYPEYDLEKIEEIRKIADTICYITCPLENFKSIIRVLGKIARARYRIVLMPELENLSKVDREYAKVNVERLRTLGIITILGREDECIRRFLNIVSY